MARKEREREREREREKHSLSSRPPARYHAHLTSDFQLIISAFPFEGRVTASVVLCRYTCAVFMPSDVAKNWQWRLEAESRYYVIKTVQKSHHCIVFFIINTIIYLPATENKWCNIFLSFSSCRLGLSSVCLLSSLPLTD